MFAGGAGIHFGALSERSVFQARKTSKIAPVMLPNPQVRAAVKAIRKGDKPTIVRSAGEGFISKLIVARRSFERAIMSPRIE